jgi:hypothetical protein
MVNVNPSNLKEHEEPTGMLKWGTLKLFVRRETLDKNLRPQLKVPQRRGSIQHLLVVQIEKQVVSIIRVLVNWSISRFSQMFMPTFLLSHVLPEMDPDLLPLSWLGLLGC